MANAQYTQKDFEALKMLEGRWFIEKGDKRIIEVWEIKSSNAMEGESYILKNGEKIPGESLKLYFENGDIFYVPTVFNQNDGKPVPFKLAEMKNNEFIFENKEHDFPQRIIYNLKSADEVDAAIEGTTENGLKRIEFPYKREN